MIGPIGVVGLVVLWGLAPAFAGLALGAASRAHLDLSLLGLSGLVNVAALWLGVRLPGDGLRAYVVPAWGELRWVLWRTGGALLALAVLGLALGSASAVAVPTLRSVDGLLQVVGVLLEAAIWLQTAGWLRCLVRPGLAALAATTLGLVGHLHAPLLEAVARFVSPEPVALLLRFTPSFAEVSLQGPLIAGTTVDRTAWALGAAHLAGWSLILGGGTVFTMTRRDPIG